MSYDDLRYNEVRQKSSHNCFQRREGVYDQVVYWRIRSLEVDLHRAKNGSSPLSDDWWVYHESFDPDTTVEKLSDFLAICRGIHVAIPDHEVVTLFLDLKDELPSTPSAARSGPVLDRVLVQNLGASLFEPSHLLDWAKASNTDTDGEGLAAGQLNTLQDAIGQRGWPTLKELRSKFMVVLTGKESALRSYLGRRSPNECAAFLSDGVDRAADVPGNQKHIVFFNMNGEKVKVAKKVKEAGLISRAYYVDTQERWAAAIENQCHHIATDMVNARKDRWSRTDHPTGYPFHALKRHAAPGPEPGLVCGVWAWSGDISGKADSFYFHYADRTDQPENRYTFLISGANSHIGDDWHKGAVLARAGLEADAAYFGVFRIGQHQPLLVQYRVRAGGTTIHKQLGRWGGYDDDTLAFVRLEISGGGRRATAWGAVAGSEDWLEIASFAFAKPLVYQGLGVSAHDDPRGAKFLFCVPKGDDRPPFNAHLRINAKGTSYGGDHDWSGTARWKVDRFG